MSYIYNIRIIFIHALLLIVHPVAASWSAEPDFSIRFRPGHNYSEPDLEAHLSRIMPRGTDLPTAVARLEAILRKRRLRPQVLHRRELPDQRDGNIVIFSNDRTGALLRKPTARFRYHKMVFVDLGYFPHSFGLVRPGAAATLLFDRRERLFDIKAHVSQGLP